MQGHKPPENPRNRLGVKKKKEKKKPFPIYKKKERLELFDLSGRGRRKNSKKGRGDKSEMRRKYRYS